MKDPLRSSESAYDILGVQPGATEREIGDAFNAGVRRGINVPRLTAARQGLMRPVDRAVAEVLEFDEAALGALSPSPLDDPGVLLADRRAATASAWEGQLRERFPDIATAHCLAMLCYWWALHLEAGGNGQGPSAVDPLVLDMWRGTIAYWCMVVATKDFWERREVPAPTAKQAGERLIQALRERLDEQARSHRARGEDASAEEYTRLELALTTEFDAARAMAEAGIRSPRGPVCCGPLLAARLGVVEDVGRLIDERRAEHPDDPNLRTLRDWLSPHANIAALMKQGRAREALAAIAALPAELASSEEVATLRARAFLVLGKQEASVRKADEALQAWRSALDAPGEEERREARESIVSLARDRAAALGKSNPDEAINFLARAREILDDLDDAHLRDRLAELLTDRGIARLNSAGDQASKEEHGFTPEIERAFMQGLEDLEWAASLGSERARTEVDTGRAMLEAFKSGMATLPPEVADLVKKANEAASRENWDSAVDLLRQAVIGVGSDAPAELKTSLAVSLANRAGTRTNAAMARGQSARPPSVSEALAEMWSTERRARPRWRRVADFFSGNLYVLFILLFTIVIPVLGELSGNKKGKKANGGRWFIDFFHHHTALFVLVFIVLPLLALLIVGVVALNRWADRNFPTSYSTSRKSKPSGPRCSYCKNSASYSINDNGKEVNLCYTHKSAVEAAMNRMDPLTAIALAQAEGDLQQAAVLDPNLSGVKENLLGVSQALTQAGVTQQARETSRNSGRSTSSRSLDEDWDRYLATLSSGSGSRTTPAYSSARPSTTTRRSSTSTAQRSTPPPPPPRRTTSGRPTAGEQLLEMRRTAGQPKPTPPTPPSTTRTQTSARVPRPRVPKREAEWPAEKVNINEASESELARLPGIGPNMAQRICAHRRAHGRFTSVDALKQVKGIGPEKFSDISSHVTVTSS